MQDAQIGNGERVDIVEEKVFASDTRLKRDLSQHFLQSKPSDYLPPNLICIHILLKFLEYPKDPSRTRVFIQTPRLLFICTTSCDLLRGRQSPPCPMTRLKASRKYSAASVMILCSRDNCSQPLTRYRQRIVERWDHIRYRGSIDPSSVLTTA